MFSVPDGRAANHPFRALTLRPPIGAPLLRARAPRSLLIVDYPLIYRDNTASTINTSAEKRIVLRRI
jgi:hypothetical protein